MAMANTYQRKIPISVDCGIHLFMEVMHGKWKVSLVWSIYNGINRPGEIHRKIATASRRVLDIQLNQLVTHGLISKKIYDQRPLKVEYELTELGKTLIPIIALTAKWGEEHRAHLEQTISSS
jgi:DNA-binding HxlR family transcriptional regulator